MRADRLLSLMLMLAARGRLTAGELATRLEVSERTIYRDVDALSSAGIPVYTQSGVNGGVFLDEHYRVSLTGFSRADIQALFVADNARPLADLGLAREATMLKLFAALPLIQRREVERARQRLYIDPTNWFQIVEASPVLPILQQAVWEDRRVEVIYQAVEGHASARTLDAYGLVAKANIWYLVARKAVGDSAGEMRNYRVARLSEVLLCDSYFERDPDFDLPSYWKDSCAQFERISMETNPPYVVTLRIDPALFWYFPGYLQGRYEVLATDDDAEGWITLQVVFDSLEHARTQVLGFGTHAIALEPRELHESVLATAEAILEFHAGRERQPG